MSQRKRVTFVLEAPGARRVCLAGSFNGWAADKEPMRPDGRGRWVKVKYLQPGEHQYKFVVDGQWWQDPARPEAAPNPYGSANSVLRL
ncbi:MAG: hypothetical protein KatS3mg121_0525 [Gammaproteobacteria bacterium]|nr:MAG: hypothetical protein KatS3mg121_0525 [Gammaproteobacteria bacterium]